MSGEELKEWRELQGMTQAELAASLSVTSLTVSRWERGDRAVPSFLPLALKTIERERKKKK